MFRILMYEILFITGFGGAIQLTKSTMKQLANMNQSINAVARLFGTIFVLVLACGLVLYMSGILTYATAR